MSVAAATGEMLRARGVENIEGIAANVAGFTVQNLGPGQSQVAIRGVSAGQIVRDQPGVKEQVGVYLDESVVSLSLFTSTPVGLDDPGMCSAQICRITTPASTNGSRKCRAKKRLSRASSTSSPPRSSTRIPSPRTGMAVKTCVITSAAA